MCTMLSSVTFHFQPYSLFKRLTDLWSSENKSMKLFNVWVSAEAAGTLKLDHDMNTSYSRKN